MEFNAYSMLIDFMWAGIFLFVAKLLREKIKILQSLFVPVSLLAGSLDWLWDRTDLELSIFLHNLDLMQDF